VGVEATRSHATAQDWLLSPDLDKVVGITAFRLHVPRLEIPDLVQETRIALWELPPTAYVSSTWIEHTSRNKAIDLLRSRTRARTREKEFVRRTVGSNGDAEPKLLLRSRVSAMPRLIRVFYALHYIAGCSERETAAWLGVSRAGVRRLDHRLRRLFLGV
jgi:RNA polymerase sigma factor (sigma-70 family)